MKKRAIARSRACSSRPSGRQTSSPTRHHQPATERTSSTKSSERLRGSKRRNRRFNHKDEDDDGEEFVVLFLKVGVCVFFAGLILWSALPGGSNAKDDATYEYADDDVGTGDNAAVGLGVRGAGETTPVGLPTTSHPTQRPALPPFPKFDIDEDSVADNFGLAALLVQVGNGDGVDNDSSSVQNRVRVLASDLRREFNNRYGGENAARYILQTASSTFEPAMQDNQSVDRSFQIPLAVRRLAQRLVASKVSKRPFKMAFGGYSVTAGRGNHFEQSYPFVLQKLLERPIKELGIPDLEVRNAALGGVPSFPYGWCLNNFLGDDPDVVSWGFAMNEANDDGGLAEGLEAYLRRVVVMKRSPMLLVEDAHTAVPRRQMLQHYADHGIGLDTLVVHTKPASEPFVTLSDGIKPPGFVEWRKFGAPPGAPGQALHHPAVKEHEFIGWVIAMHFLGAIELASVCLDDENVTLCRTTLSLQHTSNDDAIAEISAEKSLPPPTVPIQNATQMSNTLYSLLRGSPIRNEAVSSGWKMNDVSCYTTFEPSLTGNLGDLVVSGIAENSRGLDIMLPKGAQFYNQGWVLDVGDSEKRAKRKLVRYGGLGFVDSKQAFYGVNASGVLELSLPFAAHVVVVCGVNERRGENECKIERDVAFSVGGTPVEPRLIHFGSAAYLGKPICCELPILRTPSTGKNPKDNLLQISVKSTKVTTKDGACSVSHVVVGR